ASFYLCVRRCFPTRRSSDLEVGFGVGDEAPGKPEVAVEPGVQEHPTVDFNADAGVADRGVIGLGFDPITPRSATPASALKSTVRSEEHTSELQSRFELVCRL